MLCPDLRSGVEERYEGTGNGIDSFDVQPLPGVTPGAGKGEVVQFCFPVQDNRANVVHGKGGHLRLLSQVAVFTAIAGSLHHGFP
jgi:hypothetical protein